MAEPPPLRVYPELWRQSREQCPDNWQDQFRCLCALARDYRREHRAVVKTLPEGERLFLQALDQYDVEDIIATIAADFPDEPNPLLRLDPSDPFVERPVKVVNGHVTAGNDEPKRSPRCLTIHRSNPYWLFLGFPIFARKPDGRSIGTASPIARSSGHRVCIERC